MDLIPGFLSIPRWAGSFRTAGDFFSATVVRKTGPQAWLIQIEGKPQAVESSQDFLPGQVLRLKVVSRQGGQWTLQIVSSQKTMDQAERSPFPGFEAQAPLVLAFLSRGLPVAVERLKAWSRWLQITPGVFDKEGWAASMEARGWGPSSNIGVALEPWLSWQRGLENGISAPPPDDDQWELWNSHQTINHEPWLFMPLRWEYEGKIDSGLLQAHWNPQSQTIDQWNLTAAPAQVPFRLEAHSRSQSLDLTWRFFKNADRLYWEGVASGWARALSSEDFKVTLKVLGLERADPELPQEGINVRA